jgi:hypothetical protein
LVTSFGVGNGPSLQPLKNNIQSLPTQAIDFYILPSGRARVIIGVLLFCCLYCLTADIPIPITGSVIYIPIETTGIQTIVPIRA